MTDVEMKIEVEAEELTEELSDEALDRHGRTYTCAPSCVCGACA